MRTALIRTLLSSAALALGVAVGLSGCQPRVVDYRLRLVTSACVAPSPFLGATHLQFRVSGPGLEAPLVSVTPVGRSVHEIPGIPAGDDRVVEVRAWEGDPAAGGRVISLGRSQPFDVPEVVPDDFEPVEITVFLRRVNMLTPPSSADAPATCTQMLEPRAGHTATLLKDGRVLIAGGYRLAEDGSRETLYTAEIFDPATGTFEKAADMKLFSPTPRTFHGAALLHNGQVLLAGGEAKSGSSYFAVKSALVYDPDANRYGGFELKAARIRPGIATDDGGRVLIVGGADTFGNPVEYPEWYDPAKGAFIAKNPNDPEEQARANPKLISAPVPRVGMSVAPAQGGRYVAVVGGASGSQLTDEILFFSFDGTTFTRSPATVRLRELRYGAGIAPFGGRTRLLVVGGYSARTEPAQPLNTSEIISTDSLVVSDGQVLSVPRGDVCVAGLPDGRVFIVGGRTTDGGVSRSVGATEVMSTSSSGGAIALAMPPLEDGRYHHTCTTLKDGSVLILGGVEEGAAGRRVLQDAWVFVPAPVDG